MIRILYNDARHRRLATHNLINNSIKNSMKIGKISKSP
jgi:hypothetical protein